MSPAVEKTLAEISSLAPAEQQEIRELLGQGPTPPSRPTAQLVSEIKGKYSFVATSSEVFAARKQEEIDLEDQHNGKRGVIYILDASAIIAYLLGEPGADAFSAVLVACRSEFVSIERKYPGVHTSACATIAEGICAFSFIR